MIEYIRRQYNKQLNYKLKSKDDLREGSLYILIAIISTVCSIVLGYSSKTYCKVISVVVLIVIAIICEIISTKSKKKYYKNTSRIDNKIDILFNVLKKEGYSSLNSVNLLIESCNFKIQDKRPSEKILKPIKDFISIVIIPLLTYFIGFYNEELIKTSPDSLKFFIENIGYYVILGICLIIIITVIFSYIHYPSVGILDRKYNDYIEIRELLNDLKLKYYSDINDEKCDGRHIIEHSKKKIKVKVKKS